MVTKLKTRGEWLLGAGLMMTVAAAQLSGPSWLGLDHAGFLHVGDQLVY
jgi:hypothetical protein